MTADSTQGPPVRDLAGSMIDGRYLLRRFLGEGGFGGVFESRQHVLGVPMRRVAIKVSKRTGIELHTARELFADAFALADAMDRVADAGARLHLVHVYDVGIAAEHASRAYVVMEYVEGRTLAHHMGVYGRVPQPLMVGWARQACRALASLHRLDPPVVHRDIKPDNLLLGRDGVVRLVDFGLAARMLAGGLTAGVGRATPYMAPETALGVNATTADVYSLGVVLYEGLTGRRPFDELAAPRSVPAVLHDEWISEREQGLVIAPPSRRRDLDELVLACLQFDPARRPADAGALLEAIDGLPRTSNGAPDASPLRRARALRAGGDLEGARTLLQDALDDPRIDPAERVARLRELGAVLADAGDDGAAADRLVRAWQLVRDSAILPTGRARAALLGDIAACFARAGNAFQAERYRRLAARELDGEADA